MKRILGALVLVPAVASALTFNSTKDVMSHYLVAAPEYAKVGVYCGCRINTKGKTPVVDVCYTPRNPDSSRNSQREWEHLMPAENIGASVGCWKQYGRSGCDEASPVYKQAEGDPHNLRPVEGSINGDRSNYQPSTVVTDGWTYGNCQIVIDSKSKRFIPPENRRGDIARAYLYMSVTYDIRLSTTDRKMYGVWSKQDPVDNYEAYWHSAATAVSGHVNPYVLESQLQAKGETLSCVSVEPIIAHKLVEVGGFDQLKGCK